MGLLAGDPLGSVELKKKKKISQFIHYIQILKELLDHPTSSYNKIWVKP